MPGFRFWHRWLLVVSYLFLAQGLFVALWPGSVLLAPHTDATGRVFFGGALPAEAEALRVFLFAPLGATIAGFYLLQVFIVHGPFRRREAWAWHAVLWATLLWFVVDSALSAARGALFNVWMINVWPLLLVGLPLAGTYAAIFRPPDPGRAADRKAPGLTRTRAQT